MQERLEAWQQVFGTLDDAAALISALQLGVFDALRGGPLGLSSLAAKVEVSPGALRPTLDLLVALDFLRRDSGAYSLPPGEADFYDQDGPWLARMGARDLRAQFIRRAETARVLKSGEPLEIAGTGGGVSEAERRAFLEYLHSASLDVADRVAELLSGSRLHRFADIGSGIGTYSHALLRAHPEARAVLVDRPNAEAVIREYAEAADLADRIDFRPVDFLFETYGEDLDLVFLSNVVHCYGAEDNLRLLRLAVRSLRPGGLVAVKDLALQDDRRGPLSALRFGTAMALFSEGGDVWSAADITSWFAQVGLEPAGVHDLGGTHRRSQLVLGRLP